MRVSYPTSSGSKTAYAKLSDFVQNTSYSISTTTWASATTAYRRSSGNDTIGSVSAKDKVVVVSETNGRKQVIYPVSGGYKLGWVANPIPTPTPTPTHTPTPTLTPHPTLGSYKPIGAYTISTGNVTTYSSVNGSSTGYISGNNDLCSILDIYSNGWVRVSYPTNSGPKTAYAKLSDFVQNTSYSISTTTWASTATAYRKSSGTSTIGSVSAGDKVVVVSESNGRKQVIYPVSGGYKLGWITVTTPTLTVSPTSFSASPSSETKTVNVTSNISWNVNSSVSWIGLNKTSGSGNGSFNLTISANTATSARTGTITVTGSGITRTITVTQIGKVPPPELPPHLILGSYKPIGAYTISTGNVTTYSSVNGSSTGSISGNNDLCSILDIYSNGWVRVSYPTNSGPKTAYAKLSDFVQNTSYSISTTTWASTATAYRRSSGTSTIGSVSAKDKVVVVSEANGRKQVIYPVSGGYKLGWISNPPPPTPTPTPAPTLPSTGFDPIWPVDKQYRITCLQKYKDGKNHSSSYGIAAAVDIGASKGTNVLAVESGVVETSTYDTKTGFGNYIVIKHSNEKKSLYAHLNKRKDPGVGKEVKKGDVIGEVGNTSAIYTLADHLHFELSNSNPWKDYYRSKYLDVITYDSNVYSNPNPKEIKDWISTYYQLKNGIYVKK